MAVASYKRVRHAAHYAYNHPAGGHDLEHWAVPSLEGERPQDARARAGAEVPRDAEYHSGYRDERGRHHWLFVRVAPFTPDPACERCARRAALY